MGIYREVEGRLRGRERARERARVRPLAVGEQWHEDVLMPANPPQGLRAVLFECYAWGAFAILLLTVRLMHAAPWLRSLRG
jgi:hypothetical protein